MTTLNSKEDFEWHKKYLDAAAGYSHRHNGTPDKYPCKVVSSYWDDPNGPYTYDHSFVYQQVVQCECCGNSQTIWPDQAQ